MAIILFNARRNNRVVNFCFTRQDKALLRDVWNDRSKFIIYKIGTFCQSKIDKLSIYHYLNLKQMEASTAAE